MACSTPGQRAAPPPRAPVLRRVGEEVVPGDDRVGEEEAGLARLAPGLLRNSELRDDGGRLFPDRRPPRGLELLRRRTQPVAEVVTPVLRMIIGFARRVRKGASKIGSRSVQTHEPRIVEVYQVVIVAVADGLEERARLERNLGHRELDGRERRNAMRQGRSDPARREGESSRLPSQYDERKADGGEQTKGGHLERAGGARHLWVERRRS